MAMIWVIDRPEAMVYGFMSGRGGWIAWKAELRGDLEPISAAARSAEIEAIATVEAMHAAHRLSALAT